MHVKFENTFNNSPAANFDGLFDWDFLIPAFSPTKIEPTDIDGIVERHGHFLVFETKHVGKDIPLGQKILLENLILLGKDKITVYILYGKNQNNIEAMEEWYYSSRGIIKVTTPCDSSYVFTMTKAWFDKVNN